MYANKNTDYDSSDCGEEEEKERRRKGGKMSRKEEEEGTTRRMKTGLTGLRHVGVVGDWGDARARKRKGRDDSNSSTNTSDTDTRRNERYNTAGEMRMRPKQEQHRVTQMNRLLRERGRQRHRW